MKEEEQENYLLHDELVPIRIDLIIEKNRIQDCFTWNINEIDLIWKFSYNMCIDLDIPEKYVYQIANQISTQINQYKLILKEFIELQKQDETQEYIFIVKIDLVLNGISLHDQFELDVNSVIGINKITTPEIIASSIVADLGLSKEFEVCIAHSIREQVFLYCEAVINGKKEDIPKTKPNKHAIRLEEELPLWTPSVGFH